MSEPNNTRTSSNWSANTETYFVIGSGSPATIAAWSEHMRRNNIGNRRVLGTYNGQSETSFIINARDWSAMLPLLGGQESVLVLGPMPSATSFRPATLHFLEGADHHTGLAIRKPIASRLPVALGFFEPLDDDEAENWKRDYTLDGDTKYVCRF